MFLNFPNNYFILTLNYFKNRLKCLKCAFANVKFYAIKRWGWGMGVGYLKSQNPQGPRGWGIHNFENPGGPGGGGIEIIMGVSKPYQ